MNTQNSTLVGQPEEYLVSRLKQLLNDPINSTSLPLRTDLTDLLKYSEKLTRKYKALQRENGILQIRLNELVNSLELATRIDPMTDLVNRRYMLERIEREHNRSIRHARTFTVLYIDIDDFRLINSRYSYNTGDDVLVEIARVLQFGIRREDVCARWGGEEFLILLPETDARGGMAVASKLLTAVYMSKFKAQDAGIRVSISVGLCEHKAGMAPFECVERAEAALLEAKKSGKNACAEAK